jgi:CRISPR-associated protein Csd1
MLLRELVNYSHRLDIAPLMYKDEPVKYWVELSAKGECAGITTVEATDRKNLKRVNVPTVVRAGGIKAKLLADNGEYALGIGREKSKSDQVVARHANFVALVRRCAEMTGEDDVLAVSTFLTQVDRNGIAALGLPDDFDASAIVSFRVDGRHPFELASVRSFWAAEASDGDRYDCVVCGIRRPAMERLEQKLKRVPGGHSAGLAIISANSPAFESYGLAASYTGATCLECSDRFIKAANHLIATRETHLTVGDIVYVFWTRDEVGFSPATLLSDPDPMEVRTMMEGAFTGKRAEVENTRFFAAALSANGGRATVRDWIDTTVGSAQQGLVRFFANQEISDEWGRPGRFFGVYQLATATVRRGDTAGLKKQTLQALVRHALVSGGLPASLLVETVERCRLDRGVSQRQAALIKLVFLSRNQSTGEGGIGMTELDESQLDPGYLCGRLFAEIEAVQHAALGEVGATVVDRYYGTASSAPGTVFGRLVRGAQPHLAKLRRDRPGAYAGLDHRLQDIQQGLKSYPATLTLEQQGLFALGYYHQRAADRAAAIAARESRSHDSKPRAESSQEETE